jgi:heme/copper-type cytochrome/quinol oxidase subunit 2
MTVRYVVFVACVVACAVAHVAILAAVARRPARNADPGVPHPRRGIEIVWALLPALALALVVTATWERVREKPADPPVLMKVAR